MNSKRDFSVETTNNIKMPSPDKLSPSKQKKVNRKLAKFHHLLEKETGLLSCESPTRTLAICNSGLVNGLTEETVFEHFSRCGTLTHIKLLPGKSCSFVTFERIESAERAFSEFNGKLYIAQDNKPIYLLYVEQSICQTNENASTEDLPEGLLILKDFVTTDEEAKLLDLFNFAETISGTLKHRLVKHFGFEFRYDINNVDKDKPLPEPVPTDTDFLWRRLHDNQPQFGHFFPDQLTINQYLPGQGIPHHVDTHSAFENPIVCLSLGSPIVMEFKNSEKHTCVLLPQRSLLVMSGESRYNWTHGIVPRKFDIVPNESGGGCTSFKRGTRVSFTFRKVLQGQCNCDFKTKCDSFNNAKETKQMEDRVASELEKVHVHNVYESIANHFSDTRHKPWPNVLEFVQSFELGSILVDVGCGNGKYLANNAHIFDIGCDRSTNLIEICKVRNFEAFISDCLTIPVRDGYADGAISIAVIHHLANEQRRLRAVKEIARILRVGGRALIYVWAHDQIKDKEKSSYMKQDRKNRKNQTQNVSEHQREVLNGSVVLPVHTNRSNFQAKDVLVPWKLKDENKTTYLRFYHVFEENELQKLCQKVDNIELVKYYYDQGNWCILFKKVK